MARSQVQLNSPALPILHFIMSKQPSYTGKETDSSLDYLKHIPSLLSQPYKTITITFKPKQRLYFCHIATTQCQQGTYQHYNLLLHHLRPVHRPQMAFFTVNLPARCTGSHRLLLTVSNCTRVGLD